MTEATLKSLVRAECGKVTNTAEITDTDITNESVFILARIAEFVPSKVMRYITSVADQSDYDVHADTIRIGKVYPWTSSDYDFDVQWSAKSEDGTTNESYNFPSTLGIDISRRLRALPKFRASFNPADRKLKINPSPEIAGDKYWYESIEKSSWTVAALPVDFEELLVTGAVWKCFEMILKYRSQLGGVNRVGGFVDYPASSMQPLVDAKKQEFEDRLMVKAKLYFS